MWEKLQNVIRQHIVSDVPIEMEACLECGAVQCLDGKYQTCQYRLAREAALKAARMPADGKPVEPRPGCETRDYAAATDPL